MLNTHVINFKDIVDLENEARPKGHLTPIEELEDIPFEIRRIYYITRVPENTIRGHHAHKNLQQVLLCLNGTVKISVSNLSEKEIHILDDPAKGLYIGPGVWREIYDFSPAAVLLVLASEHYIEDDYIRDYKTYCEYVYESERGHIK